MLLEAGIIKILYAVDCDYRFWFLQVIRRHFWDRRTTVTVCLFVYLFIYLLRIKTAGMITLPDRRHDKSIVQQHGFEAWNRNRCTMEPLSHVTRNTTKSATQLDQKVQDITIKDTPWLSLCIVLYEVDNKNAKDACFLFRKTGENAQRWTILIYRLLRLFIVFYYFCLFLWYVFIVWWYCMLPSSVLNN